MVSWLVGWMDRWMDAWMERWIVGWVGGSIDAYGQVERLQFVCLFVWLAAWMNE